MRKTLLILLAISAIVWFTGASPWEGAASVAPAGVLPATGFFVATNSFPKNTVVDITNIETGKSTRAIVAKTLDSPGLLAIISNEAAQLIGMRSGSVSRIRMVQPSDPIAYLRFSENSAFSGNPGYDSGNVITEEDLVAEVYSEDTYVPKNSNTEVVQTKEPVAPPAAASNPGVVSPPGYLEPEWGGTERLNIVDLPGYEMEREDPFIIEQPPVQIAEEETKPPAPIVNEPISPVATEPSEKKEEEPVYASELPKEKIKDISTRYEEKPPIKVTKDLPDFWDETEANEISKDLPSFLAEQPKNDFVKETFDYSTEQPKEEIPEKEFNYSLVETDPKPPEPELYGIDPSDIIPGIAIATPEKQPVQATPELYTPPSASEDKFSFQTKSSLARGQYYVQVAALPAETVENAIKQIDQRYSPFVLVDRDNWYRIIIGPLNQGESAAVLARFKSIGYTDAFVRKGN